MHASVSQTAMLIDAHSNVALCPYLSLKQHKTLLLIFDVVLASITSDSSFNRVPYAAGFLGFRATAH